MQYYEHAFYLEAEPSFLSCSRLENYGIFAVMIIPEILWFRGIPSICAIIGSFESSYISRIWSNTDATLGYAGATEIAFPVFINDKRFGNSCSFIPMDSE